MQLPLEQYFIVIAIQAVSGRRRASMNADCRRGPSVPLPLTEGLDMQTHHVTIESSGETFRCAEDVNVLAALQR